MGPLQMTSVSQFLLITVVNAVVAEGIQVTLILYEYCFGNM